MVTHGIYDLTVYKITNPLFSGQCGLVAHQSGMVRNCLNDPGDLVHGKMVETWFRAVEKQLERINLLKIKDLNWGLN